MGNDRGFTLIEIIAVLVLLGVVAVALVSVFSEDSLEESVAADTLKAHLRYARSRAMNSDVSWGLQFNGSSYTLMKDTGGTPTAEYLPGENSVNVDFPGNVAGTASFDTWGRPSGLSSIPVGDRTITITPDTGFIP